MNKKMFDVNYEGIPDELLERDQWVCWKYEDGSSDSKSAKSFFDAKTRGSGYDGIGFMLSVDDPFVAIELNDVINPEGVIEPWALNIIDLMDSYTEINPEGTGILIIIKGKKPAGAGCIGGPDGKLGVYDCERMIPVTGERLIDTPRTIERRQAQVDELCKQLSGSEPPIGPPASGFKRLVDSKGKLQGFLEE